MRIVLLGPPGSGKGTQAGLLRDRYGVPQISTGEIFRKAISEKTALGAEAEKYISKGALVPDDVTIGLVRERLQEKDTLKGFILDGFPRTIPQARGVEEVLRELGWELDAVIHIDVPQDVLLKRLALRLTCPSCGAVYNVEHRPPAHEGECDSCGAALGAREDDTEETFRTRLKVYRSQTLPLVDYYKRLSRLINIDGSGSVEDVFQNINAALEDRRAILGQRIDDKSKDTGSGCQDKGELHNSRRNP